MSVLLNWDFRRTNLLDRTLKVVMVDVLIVCREKVDSIEDRLP